MATGAQGKAPVEVVEIESSDDEGNTTGGGGSSKLVTKALPMQIKKPKVELQIESGADRQQQLEFRSFWKAGAAAVGPSTTSSLQGDLEHARVHPKFLHSNATSHKWAFGAIAELLDNAVDEICNGATFVKVDRTYNKKDSSPALLIQDDGGGMSPDGIRKCMSLGYSSKTSNSTIGQYGNGFKTSTMRLGADVIVFSRASQSGRVTQSVGLLSYTFLRRTGQDDVVVPMIDFDISGNWAEPIIYSSRDDWYANLKTILEWSPFSSKNDLMQQCEDIGSHGTKIIIYNLWLNDEGIYELNFDDDDEDIRLRDEASAGNLQKPNKRRLLLQSHISYRLRFSLRAYSSMLYMRKFKNFKILLRGKAVEQLNFADELKYTKTFTYRPHLAAASTEVSVATTVGFIKEAPELGVCGFNAYHKNRLIRPFWKVTPDGNSKGYGVVGIPKLRVLLFVFIPSREKSAYLHDSICCICVGVLEANFIEPAHDKQDFEQSTLFFKLEARLKQMINEYWKDHCHLVGHQPVGRPQQLPTGKNVNRMPVIDLSEADEEGGGIDGSTVDIDQIREENIQLVTRCEKYLQKENELLRTVEALEKQLAETKAKSAKLSLHIEAEKLKLKKQPMQQHRAF